jgi:malonyl-CoA O-methyltransferase
MDFSEGMLRQARARITNARVRFIQHDVRSLWPLADKSADLVIAMLILEHVERLEPVFAEAARTLTTGGDLLICELHPRRQLLGKQAKFTSARTGEHKRVEAFLHQTEDYVNAGLSCGFELVNAVDWRDADSRPDEPPRLLWLHFRLLRMSDKPGLS